MAVSQVGSFRQDRYSQDLPFCTFRDPGAARYVRFAARSAAPCAPSPVMRTGFACTFHGHPYGEYHNMILN